MAAKTDEFDSEVSQTESDMSELNISTMSDENLQATDTEDGEYLFLRSAVRLMCNFLMATILDFRTADVIVNWWAGEMRIAFMQLHALKFYQLIVQNSVVIDFENLIVDNRIGKSYIPKHTNSWNF